MIALALLVQAVAPAPPGPQPQIAWACEMQAPDGTKFQLAGKITGGLLPPGESDPAKLTRRLATVSTDTSGRLSGTIGSPYLYASWKGEGYFSLSLPAPGDRYTLALQLFENGRRGLAHLTLGNPQPKEALGIGYCISKWQGAGRPQSEKKKP
ncbi:MAG TPA: hypothetical protein VF574_07600 [Allosphingosinicella sp.]|jgi:hypothetical protein